MNILRLSTLTLGLAVAVFALGYAAPLQADDLVCDVTMFCDRDGDGAIKDHKRCDHCSGEPDCDDSDGDVSSDCADTGNTKTIYDVVVPVDESGTGPLQICNGTAVRGLGVAGFGTSACPITLTENMSTTHDLCLCQVGVKNTKNETSVMLFFDNSCLKAGCGDVWNSARLPASIVMMGSSGDFTVTEVDNSFKKVELTKNHQGGMGTPLQDTIDVGDIVYTAQ